MSFEIGNQELRIQCANHMIVYSPFSTGSIQLHNIYIYVYIIIINYIYIIHTLYTDGVLGSTAHDLDRDSFPNNNGTANMGISNHIH